MGKKKKVIRFWVKKNPKENKTKKQKKTEKKRDSCSRKTSSEVEIKRNRLNKEIKNFIWHLMVTIMKKISM